MQASKGKPTLVVNNSPSAAYEAYSSKDKVTFSATNVDLGVPEDVPASADADRFSLRCHQPSACTDKP